MNSPRRSFLRRAFGMAVAAPAITRLIANGGAATPPALPPLSVRDFNPVPLFSTSVPPVPMSCGWYPLGTHLLRATTSGNYYERRGAE